jgi:hypothetical protein
MTTVRQLLDQTLASSPKGSTHGTLFSSAKHLPQRPCRTSWKDASSLRDQNNPLTNVWYS